MALVTIVTGDCPGCGLKGGYGNVDVRQNAVLRGCKRCDYRTWINLPALTKKVVYLDQHFFSHAFRGGNAEFVRAADKVRRLARLQLLVAPFSTVHEDETQRITSEKRPELLAFIKALASGTSFNGQLDVERTQIVRAFKRYLAGESPLYLVAPDEALPSDINDWTGYMYVSINRQFETPDALMAKQSRITDDMLKLFDQWRSRDTTFKEDVALENVGAAISFVKQAESMARAIAAGKFDDFLLMPATSQTVQILLGVLHKLGHTDVSKVSEFLGSEHFRQIPYIWISSRVFALVRRMIVDQSAYSSEAKARAAAAGLLDDMKHIGTYLPYVDAIFVDKAMANTLLSPQLGLFERYGTRVFSTNTMEEFIQWMDEIEQENLTHALSVGLDRAYSHLT